MAETVAVVAARGVAARRHVVRRGGDGGGRRGRGAVGVGLEGGHVHVLGRTAGWRGGGGGGERVGVRRRCGTREWLSGDGSLGGWLRDHPQQPLAFANSERRNDVSVRFPCTSAAPILIYWNAEYAPGRFAFRVADS